MSSSHWRADMDDGWRKGGSARLLIFKAVSQFARNCIFIYGVIYFIKRFAVTYDHRLRTTGHPVRSAIHKPQIGRLVVGWVTTSEYLLLYVFYFLFIF
jgi:hypothetical protein